jgi:hypothetical protein
MKEGKKEEPEALFIPAGVLTGIGFGFLFNSLLAGLFIGLGTGFIIFTLFKIVRAERDIKRVKKR